jgi:Zn-dependent alcohol dehydrogenase
VVRGIVAGDADPHVFIPQLVALHAEGRGIASLPAKRSLW